MSEALQESIEFLEKKGILNRYETIGELCNGLNEGNSYAKVNKDDGEINLYRPCEEVNYSVTGSDSDERRFIIGDIEHIGKIFRKTIEGVRGEFCGKRYYDKRPIEVNTEDFEKDSGKEFYKVPKDVLENKLMALLV